MFDRPTPLIADVERLFSVLICLIAGSTRGSYRASPLGYTTLPTFIALHFYIRFRSYTPE
jgi:hypothetical protein